MILMLSSSSGVPALRPPTRLIQPKATADPVIAAEPRPIVRCGSDIAKDHLVAQLVLSERESTGSAPRKAEFGTR